MLFAYPTVNDFRAQLDMQSERAEKNFLDRQNNTNSDFIAAGSFSSSRRVVLILDILEQITKESTASILAELRRALDYPELDSSEIRNMAYKCIRDIFKMLFKHAQLTQNDSYKNNVVSGNLIESAVKKIDSKIEFWIRQFEIGWERPVQAEKLIEPPV